MLLGTFFLIAWTMINLSKLNKMNYLIFCSPFIIQNNNNIYGDTMRSAMRLGGLSKSSSFASCVRGWTREGMFSTEVVSLYCRVHRLWLDTDR